jgi:endoglucanase Acf2
MSRSASVNNILVSRFWGAETVEIAAIQMLPVTPVNEYLYDSEWVQNVWYVLSPT